MEFSLRQLLSAVLDVYLLAIVAYVVLGWLPAQYRRYRIHAFLEAVSEPLLRPIRRALPGIGGIDISPLIALLLLRFGGRFLLRYVPG